MAKEIDKIIKSPTPPKDTNVLWDNGENLKIYRNGKWENTNTTEIKENSIPLNALDASIKELLNNSLGFKTFVGYLSIDEPLEIQAFTGGGYYYVNAGGIIVKLNTDIEETPIPYGPPFSIKYEITEYPKAKLSIITNYPIPAKFPIFRGINSNEAFITDTVLKTTPQTLSTANKNQALANLGIADLLEALKPVQLLSPPPIGNVTQEQLDEIGLTEKVINNILNGYTNKICIGNVIHNVTTAYVYDGSAKIIFSWFEFADGTLNGFSQYTYEYSKNSDDIIITNDEF